MQERGIDEVCLVVSMRGRSDRRSGGPYLAARQSCHASSSSTRDGVVMFPPWEAVTCPEPEHRRPSYRAERFGGHPRGAASRPCWTLASGHLSDRSRDGADHRGEARSKDSSPSTCPPSLPRVRRSDARFREPARESFRIPIPATGLRRFRALARRRTQAGHLTVRTCDRIFHRLKVGTRCTEGLSDHGTPPSFVSVASGKEIKPSHPLRTVSDAPRVGRSPEAALRHPMSDQRAERRCLPD